MVAEYEVSIDKFDKSISFDKIVGTVPMGGLMDISYLTGDPGDPGDPEESEKYITALLLNTFPFTLPTALSFNVVFV
jgi:hypothetical protein